MAARRRGHTLIGIALALAMVAAACASSGGDGTSAVDTSVAGDSGAPVEERASERPAAEEPLYAESESTGAALDDAEPPAPVEEPDSEVTAASVDDNELWDEYLLYRQDFFTKGIPVSDVDVSGRLVLTVVDVDGDPVLGAGITVTDAAGATVATLRTHADGRAVFHRSTDVDPASQSRPRYTASVEKAGVTTEAELDAGALAQTIALEADLPSAALLDVLFLIDTTGSMSDEIERLKANMISVAEQISALPSAPDVRFGLVTYRDRGDEYVTQTSDFTGDVLAYTETLAEVVADGGGDTPESLNAALHDALVGPGWRGDDTVKLVFLLADAPPHLAGEPGYEDEFDYADDIVEAAAEGVKVFPIASSGLDEQGEFVFRQLAQISMGRFVFLTYGADGLAPGTSTPHHVDPADYDVLALDDLIVQQVADELAHLAS